jgi:hypothetical protein
MNDLEERLRRDLRAVSQLAQPDTIRTLREPMPRRHATAIRWLAPVMAMVAVAGIAVGVTLAGRATSGPPSATAGHPQIYVTESYRALYPRHGRGTGVDTADAVEAFATVRDAATGAALTSVRLWVNHKQKGAAGGIPIGTLTSITAARDDRTFAIQDEKGFFLLRVAGNGRRARLTRVPVSLDGAGAISAISPDGSRLAIEDAYCPRICAEYTRLRIVSVTTGAGRTWTTRPMNGPSSLAWTADGHQLMFLWGNGGWFRNTEYRLLDADAPPGNLLARSRPMPYPAMPKGTAVQAVPTADGRALVVVLTRVRSAPGKVQVMDYRIVEMSPVTGRIMATLYRKNNVRSALGRKWPPPFTECNVLSLTGAGVHALIQCPVFGRLDGSRFTPLSVSSWPAILAEFVQFGVNAAW